MDTKCDENVCLEGVQSNFSKEQWRQSSYPLGTSCWGIHGQPVGKLVVPDDIRVNLCTQTPRRNATCMHAQGTLAGPGQEVGSVYERLAAGALLVLTTMEGGTQLLEDVQKGVEKVTVEGADLAIEIGKKVNQDFDKKKLPLMLGMINAIMNDKKLELDWQYFN